MYACPKCQAPLAPGRTICRNCETRFDSPPVETIAIPEKPDSRPSTAFTGIVETSSLGSTVALATPAMRTNAGESTLSPSRQAATPIRRLRRHRRAAWWDPRRITSQYLSTRQARLKAATVVALLAAVVLCGFILAYASSASFG